MLFPKFQLNKISPNRIVYLSFLFLLTIGIIYLHLQLKNAQTKNLSYQEKAKVDDRLIKKLRDETVSLTMTNKDQVPPNINIEPGFSKNKTKMTTPIIKSYDGTRNLEIQILPGWKFSKYEFNYCHGEANVCEYFLSISNIDNPSYGFNNYAQDIEYSFCDFEDLFPKDIVYQQEVDLVRNVQTNFGLLKIAKDKKTQRLVVCQNTKKEQQENVDDYVSVTNIGFMNISVPEKYDERLFNEIVEMIKTIKVVEYSN